MNESVDIGLFLARPGDADFGGSKILLLRPMPIVSGTQTMHLVSPAVPAFAGIDPYDEWINRDLDDTIVAASPAGRQE
jgi:ABC-2 type transport system permease protein